MVRDVRSSSESDDWREERTVKLTNFTTVSQSSSSRFASYSQRDDITETVPVNGKYVSPTTYHAFFGSNSTESGNCTWEDWQASYVQSWTGFGAVSPFDSFFHGCDGNGKPIAPWELQQRASAQALDEVRQTDFNTAVSLGELRETGQTLLNLLLDAVRLLKNPLRLLQLGASPKRVAEAWLTVQYGIKPLMYDCAALADHLLNASKTGIVTVKSVTMDSDFGYPQSPSPYLRFSGECRRGIETGYTFMVADQTRYDMWRLGMINPFSLAWELTTLSFVVDWFTGMGNFLQGLIGPQGLVFISGYQTTFVRNDFVTEQRVYPDHAENVSGGWKRVKSRTRAMKRDKLFIFDRPLPYFSFGLSPTQVGSALALLTVRSR